MAYVIELEYTIKNGLNFAVLPHFADFAKHFTDIGAIFLEVQKVTKVETADALILLVEF